MTHGDKQKAKAGKDQASGSKSSSSKVAVESKAGENGKSPRKNDAKGGVKSAPETKAGSKVSLKKGGPPEKAAAKASGAKAGAQTAAEAKGSDSSGKAGSKARGGAAEEAPGFSNPVIGDAFRNALKKYPNAFRKLTD